MNFADFGLGTWHPKGGMPSSNKSYGTFGIWSLVSNILPPIKR